MLGYSGLVASAYVQMPALPAVSALEQATGLPVVSASIRTTHQPRKNGSGGARRECRGSAEREVLGTGVDQRLPCPEPPSLALNQGESCGNLTMATSRPVRALVMRLSHTDQIAVTKRTASAAPVRP